MYVRVGTLILPGQFPRLREEWEGLRIEELEIGDKSKNTFRALLPHTQDSSCLRGVATSLPNSLAILTTRSTSSALFLARTPFE